jgi:hypothetical protein
VATAYLCGAGWQRIDVPLRGPAPSELATRFDAARAWVRDWERAAGRRFRLEYRQVGGRAIGANTLPSRAWVDGYDDFFALLGVGLDVERLERIVRLTDGSAPVLAGWVRRNPLTALAEADRWPDLLATATWVERHGGAHTYLREIDVPGVDTKFIEQNQRILSDLLDELLPADRVDRAVARSDLAGRYGLRRKPDHVRVRTLDDARPLAAGFTEASLRVDELAAAGVAAARVFVVENEVTFLAFPPVPDAVVILGGGYSVRRLQPLAWLRSRDVVYWGDIDTHGFAILNRLRHAFPHVRSMLMDHKTLHAHGGQWVREPQPSTAVLDRLTPDELDLYRDLVEDAFGESVRLEQERVGFAAVREALG